jgi:hypothetical protein
MEMSGACDIDCPELSPEEAEAFCVVHEIMDHAKQRFLALHPKFQFIVIQKTMEGAKDKTAVLLTRINMLSRSTPGDWLCPMCNDLQFAKNANCRQCGARKPQ